jgi:trigger factor
LVSLDLPAEPQEANELEKALIGRAPGSTMPWMQEKEGGEREELVLRVVKVEAPELPSLDDEFVRKHFRVQSLDELRRLLFEEKRAELAEARRRARERAAFEQLLERHQVEVSERMLEVESRQVLEDFARSLAERGVRLDDPKIPWGELQAQARSQAERNLKIRFILDAISEREKIDVSEEEFERYLAWEARKAKTSPHALRHRWYEQGVLAEVRQGLRRRKVVARLIEGVPSATG